MSPYEFWRPEFAKAIDPRFFDILYLDWLIRTGRAQFHAGERAAIVTEIKTYPSGAKAVCGVVGAGDLDEIIEVLIPAAEAWGKEQYGCRYALIESRPGWQRALRKHGYQLHQVAVVKGL